MSKWPRFEDYNRDHLYTIDNEGTDWYTVKNGERVFTSKSMLACIDRIFEDDEYLRELVLIDLNVSRKNE